VGNFLEQYNLLPKTNAKRDKTSTKNSYKVTKDKSCPRAFSLNNPQGPKR